MLAFQLRSGGIPLDEEVLESIEAACRGLSIHPAGNMPDTRIFELDSGGWGLMVSLAIHNDSPRILWLNEFRPEIPWWEPRFRWLEYPLGKVPREYTYSFPDPGPVGFEPDDVLNHRLGRKGRLCPGDWIEGLLLGVGQEPMPSDYQDRQLLVMRLWVFDERGSKFGADIKLLVERWAQRVREGKLREMSVSIARRRGRLLVRS